MVEVIWGPDVTTHQKGNVAQTFQEQRLRSLGSKPLLAKWPYLGGLFHLSYLYNGVINSTLLMGSLWELNS